MSGMLWFFTCVHVVAWLTGPTAGRTSELWCQAELSGKSRFPLVCHGSSSNFPCLALLSSSVNQYIIVTILVDVIWVLYMYCATRVFNYNTSFNLNLFRTGLWLCSSSLVICFLLRCGRTDPNNCWGECDWCCRLGRYHSVWEYLSQNKVWPIVLGVHEVTFM